MEQRQETRWTKIKRTFPSLFGYSRQSKGPDPSASARWSSLEDDYELPPGLKALSKRREGTGTTSEIDELKSRAAKLDSLDATVRLQAKAIEKLTEKNAAMEKKLAELTAAVAQQKRYDQGSSFMCVRSREIDGAAATEEKIAELWAAVAQLKTISFKSNRGPPSTNILRVREERDRWPPWFLIVIVFLLSVLIGIVL